MKKLNSSATWWIVYTSRYLFPVSLLWVLLIPIHTLVFFCPFFPSYTLLCRISFFPIVLLHICTLIHPTLNAQEFFRLYQGTFDPIDFKGKVNKCACLQPSNSYSLIHVQNKNHTLQNLQEYALLRCWLTFCAAVFKCTSAEPPPTDTWFINGYGYGYKAAIHSYAYLSPLLTLPSFIMDLYLKGLFSK